MKHPRYEKLVLFAAMPAIATGAFTTSAVANTPPTVNAGDDRQITLPIRFAALYGTAEDDGIGEPNGFLAIMWSKVSGPGEVAFEPNESVKDPIVTLSATGEYVLMLSANDGEEYSHDEVTIMLPEPNCPVGDMNGNCVVDYQDVQTLVCYWVRGVRCTGFGCPNLDGLGMVDMFDCALLAASWLEKWLGSLQLTISPQEAIDAGAQWQADAGRWRDSGHTEPNLSVGSHTVDFKSIGEWIKQDPQTVEISAGRLSTVSGVYLKHRPFFGLYVSEVQVRSDGATGRDVEDRTGVEWDKPEEFVENWLAGYLGVNFADIVLYQAGDGIELKMLMFEVDNISEDKLIDGTLAGIRGKSMDGWGAGGPEDLLEAAGQHDVVVVYNIQPREMTEDQIVGVVSAAFYRFASYPAFLGMVVDCEFCDTMETGSTWREDGQLRARMLSRACAVRDHYEGIHGREFYIFAVWYRTLEPPFGSGARPWHIYFPDVANLHRLVPIFDGADDRIGHDISCCLGGGANAPKNHGIEATGHSLFLRKKQDGHWVQLDQEAVLDACLSSWAAGNDFIEAEYWYHVVKGTGGWERCYGPEVKAAADLILHGSLPAQYLCSK